ncbi:hypothetical protein IX321_000224 [Bacteroides pyogenes]|nr:hypothetical protein [Bacteroides pyogenes]MBR8716262.1 hypothetical protein [Bacteroides pyogenes]MBR8745803.1 hypothetical protein [Bacteroides pyogenes]MBR8756098.1 hypothetical protein [Bacteroides pyogenes]MBR8779414.1 hypothetical protein [Bacteroides pyogenes]
MEKSIVSQTDFKKIIGILNQTGIRYWIDGG